MIRLQWLDRLQEALRPYETWPLPWSGRVVDTMQALHKESNLIGTNLWHSAMAFGSFARITSEHVPQWTNSRPVYYFIDAFSLFSSHWYKIAGLEHFDALSDQRAFVNLNTKLTTEEQMALLHHMIAQWAPQRATTFANVLAKLTPEVVGYLVEECQALMEQQSR